MKNLKELFNKKEEIEKLQKEISEMQKISSFDKLVLKFFILYTTITFILGIYSGLIFNTEIEDLGLPLFLFFICSFVSIFSAMLVNKIKQKLNKLNKEELKILHIYDIEYSKEIHNLIIENMHYFEIFKKENKQGNIFISNLIYHIKNSNKDELIDFKDEIKHYLNNDLDKEYDKELISEVVLIIEEKINGKEDELENKLDSILNQKENKNNIIKSL